MRSVFLLIAMIFVGAGCNDRPASGPLPVHPVSGQVLYRGKPLADALVVFHPASSADSPRSKTGEGPPSPTGNTDSEGKFSLHTYIGNDGAPIGEYKATVALARTGEIRNVMAKETPKPIVISVPAKYGDPAQSGLTATVKSGDNTLEPFDLP